jgi:uncharacterized protein (TIGR02246 family)
MGVASPELMAGAYQDCFNRSDAKGMLELYEPEAVLTFDGKAQFAGRARIEGALAKMLARKGRISGKYVDMQVAGDTAMARMQYEVFDESGKTTTTAVSIEVLRRGTDGKWRFLIDDASGASRGAG